MELASNGVRAPSHRPLLPSFLVLALGLLICRPQFACAQKAASISTVDSVRVVFGQVDSVVFAFGLDTAQIRTRIGDRLGNAIKAVVSAQAPRLRVNLFVLGGAGEESAAGVFLELLEPAGSAGSQQGRQLWRARGPHAELPSYRLIPEVMGRLLDDQLNLFLVDRQRARGGR